MRMFLASLCCLTFTAVAAHAEPGVVQHVDAARESTYFSTGLAFGSVESHTAVGAQVDAGVHVVGALWLHAGVTGSVDISDLLFFGSGTAISAHAGAELSSCHRGERVCAYAGAAALTQSVAVQF
jgi:hypothetical protein